jgi:hypothetical protein
MPFLFLNFLTTELFVVSWYVSGLLLAIWVIYDLHHVNTSVNKSLKAGWPIIFIFFSVVGFFLYILTCRPGGMSFVKSEVNKKVIDKNITIDTYPQHLAKLPARSSIVWQEMVWE